MFSLATSCSCLCSKHPKIIQAVASGADIGLGITLLFVGVIGSGYLSMSPAAGYALFGVGGGLIAGGAISMFILALRNFWDYFLVKKEMDEHDALLNPAGLVSDIDNKQFTDMGNTF